MLHKWDPFNELGIIKQISYIRWAIEAALLHELLIVSSKSFKIVWEI